MNTTTTRVLILDQITQTELFEVCMATILQEGKMHSTLLSSAKQTTLCILSLSGIIFEMRLFNLRINLFIYCGLFPLILVVFCVVSSFTMFRPNSLWPSSGDFYRYGPDSGRPDKDLWDQKIHPWSPFGAHGAADRGGESLRFQVSIVRR